MSFLRRTEYITASQATSKYDAASTKDILRQRTPARKRRRPDVARDDRGEIIRNITRGFDLAYPHDAYRGPETTTQVRGAEIIREDRDAWAKPQHPTKRDVSLLDSYPILPDLDAICDMDGFNVTKFQTNPAAASNLYDTRLDVSVLLVGELSPEEQTLQMERLAAYEADPSLPRPAPEYEYEFFIPQNQTSVPSIKRKWDMTDPENDSEELYDADSQLVPGARCFQYGRQRAYETYQQTMSKDVFNDSVVLALHDPALEIAPVPGAEPRKRQKAGYVYPVVQRTFVRPKRKAQVRGGAQDEEDRSHRADALEVYIRAPTDEESSAKAAKKEVIFGLDEGTAAA